MAIFVTEDDAQDGRDHVDAHRSVLMVISPYAKRGYVSHAHTSIASILKTFDLIFSLAHLEPVRRGRHRPRGFLHRSAGLYALRRAAQRPAHFRSRQSARTGIGLEGAARALRLTTPRRFVATCASTTTINATGRLPDCGGMRSFGVRQQAAALQSSALTPKVLLVTLRIVYNGFSGSTRIFAREEHFLSHKSACRICSTNSTPSSAPR